ncbi:MAG: ParB N-terminal domain-containing protein [Waterburya sp.]
MVKQSINVKDKFRDRFSSAKTAQQETNKIKELKQKIKELESARDTEGHESYSRHSPSSAQTEASTGKFWVELDKIEPSKQCRQTFTENVIQKRMRSLLREGQLDPLVLISLSETEKRYQIEDGEVTWRAAKRLVEQGQAKWERLEVVLSNIDDLNTIHFRTLLHHLHSEGLNPLDRAESIMAEINLQLEIETEAAVKLLRNIFYRSSRDINIAEAIANYSEEGKHHEYLEQQLESTQVKLISLFNRLQIELGSFVNNDLGMLALTDKLKTAIREKELPCHQAKLINKLSSKTLSSNEQEIEQITNEALEYVLDNKLSVDKTRKYINQIIEAQGKKNSTSVVKVKKNYQQLKTELQKLPVSQLTKTQLNSLKSIMEKQLVAINQELKQ